MGVWWDFEGNNWNLGEVSRNCEGKVCYGFWIGSEGIILFEEEDVCLLIIVNLSKLWWFIILVI